jgi:hypothetical protein
LGKARWLSTKANLIEEDVQGYDKIGHVDLLTLCPADATGQLSFPIVFILRSPLPLPIVCDVKPIAAVPPAPRRLFLSRKRGRGFVGRAHRQE